MQLPTQAQFVADCLVKYRWEQIPSDQQWEAAHFPLPACSGEDVTVQLWSADHTVQGLLQSVDLDHKCFHYARTKKDLYNLQTYYPEYLQLFQQLRFKFNSRQGKIGGKKTFEFGVGVCGRSSEKMTADGKKGGKISGKKTAELKLGIHGQSAEQMKANCKKGGKISNAQRWQCSVTDYISTACGLSHYQKARGIDTKMRVKIS